MSILWQRARTTERRNNRLLHKHRLLHLASWNTRLRLEQKTGIKKAPVNKAVHKGFLFLGVITRKP